MGRKRVVEHNGELFDSKLELNHFFYFEQHPKITVIERQKRFLLLEGFKYYDIEKAKERKARHIVYTCDFIIKHEDYDKLIAWESKGYARKDYRLRAKLFRKKFPEYYFIEVHSMKQAQEIFGRLKEVT